MDPDICDTHVHKGLHLSVPPKNCDQQGVHSVSATLNRSSGSEQYYLDDSLDRSVSACMALLGQP